MMDLGMHLHETEKKSTSLGLSDQSSIDIYQKTNQNEMDIYQKTNENKINIGTGQIQVEQVEKPGLEFRETSTTLGLPDQNSIDLYQINRTENDMENDQVQMKQVEFEKPSLEYDYSPELPPLPPPDPWELEKPPPSLETKFQSPKPLELKERRALEFLPNDDVRALEYLPEDDVILDTENNQGLLENTGFNVNSAKKRKLYQGGMEKDFGKKLPKLVEDELRGKKCDNENTIVFWQPFDRSEGEGVHVILPLLTHDGASQKNRLTTDSNINQQRNRRSQSVPRCSSIQGYCLRKYPGESEVQSWRMSVLVVEVP